MQKFEAAPIAWPLNCNEDLIRLISSLSQEPLETVARRLLDEERCIGINVRREVLECGLRPHVWSEDLIEYYSKTKAFLYETAVWNRSPMKRAFRERMSRFLEAWQAENPPKTPLRILCFGDGLGFDTEYLCQAGYDVTYFEVSRECERFARAVFENNGVFPQIVNRLEDLQPESFDAIMCFDVLEHVPSPPDVVASFARWLKPQGRLITHNPFWLIHPYYATHLRANRKYSGSLSLYRRHQLEPVDGELFWDPIILEKTAVRRVLRGKAAVGRVLLRVARRFNLIHCWVARFLCRHDARWQQDLEKWLESHALNSPAEEPLQKTSPSRQKARVRS
jgi:SAM-dependent methyltransferase